MVIPARTTKITSVSHPINPMKPDPKTMTETSSTGVLIGSVISISHPARPTKLAVDRTARSTVQIGPIAIPFFLSRVVNPKTKCRCCELELFEA